MVLTNCSNNYRSLAVPGEVDPCGDTHARLINLVSDSPGHDRRYAIDPMLIRSELGWQTRQILEQGLESTVRCFLDNLGCCKAMPQVRRQPRS